MTTSLQNRSRQVFSTRILHLIGYGLLVVATVNIAWSIDLGEFQIGRVIERMPIVLLGMVLVYYQQSDRTSMEITFLKTLSWLSLVSAILLLAIIPLNISNSWLTYHRQNAMPSEVKVARQDLIQQFKDQLEAADSQAEIGAVLQQQVARINISDLVNIPQLKDNILTDLSRDRDTIVRSTFRAEKRSRLLKNCLRWNLGALVASTLFFMFWQSTRYDKIE